VTASRPCTVDEAKVVRIGVVVVADIARALGRAGVPTTQTMLAT